MIKRIFCIVLCLAMLTGLASLLPVSAADKPDGTAIATEQQFLAMQTGGKYYLSADITLSKSYSKGTFSGVFDGNGHKITLSGGTLSAFDSISGNVKNLTIDGKINLTSSSNAAALAKNGSGKFENVTSNVAITVTGSDVYNGRLSGIVALVNGGAFFNGCKNNGNIQINTSGSCNTRNVWVGGVISMIDGNYTVSLNNCVNSGNIISKQTNVNIGGLVGWSSGADLILRDCVNKGELYTLANGYTGIGGMLGGMYNANQQSRGLTAAGCVNEGRISAGDATSSAVNAYAGGIIGQVYSVGNLSLSNCVNKGMIDLRSGTSGSAAGGMAGMFITVSSAWSWAGFDRADYVIKNCVNQGQIFGLDVGGMVASGTQLGFNKDEISLHVESCVNTADLWGVGYAGGIVGRWANSEGNGWSSGTADVTISKCMNIGTVEGLLSAAGIFAYMESEGILSERKSATVLGDKIGDSQKLSLVEYCINSGDVICNSGVDNKDNIRVAAGIVAHTNRKMTVNACVNIGRLDMPANDKPCLAHIISTQQTVTAENNVYLDTIRGKDDNARAVKADALLSAIDDKILAYEALAIMDNIAKAKALNKDEYEAESYAALMAVCDSAAKMLGSDTDITRVSQKSVEGLLGDFEESFANLKRTTANEESENDTEDNTTVGENKPAKTDKSTVAADKGDKSESDAEESGCGSVLGSAPLVAIAVLTLGVGASLKKE